MEKEDVSIFDIWTNIKFRLKASVNIYEAIFAEICFAL